MLSSGKWLRWLVGAVTILAAAILIFSIVLGVRAGQRQWEIQNRQQVGIYLQQAVDYRTEGDLNGALAAYRQVLVLDPDNVAANQGVETILALGTTVGIAMADDQALSEPVVAPASDSLTTLWESAQSSFEVGRWQEAIDQLQQIQIQDAAYRAESVAQMLYTAYFNLAVTEENNRRLDEALTLYEQAVAIKPNGTEAREAGELLNRYITLLSVPAINLARTVQELEAIYKINPSYQDVAPRLQTAYMNYGDSLVRQEAWCQAVRQYNAAIAIRISPGSISKRDKYQSFCENPPTAVARSVVQRIPTATRTATTQVVARVVQSPNRSGSVSISTPTIASERVAVSTATPTATAQPTVPPVSANSSVGRILYSARDLYDGRTRIFAQKPGEGSPTVLQDDGTQPAMQSSGLRMAFRNIREDSRGLSSVDPGSGLELRYSHFAEDTLPSWSPDGNRIVFASNREGDRRWRIYVMWAEVNGATESKGFGEAPEWHPSADQIAYRGCDETGNRCGLWLMNSGGTGRLPLTTTPSDTRPVWSPDGRTIAFSSDGRHGNPEIYLVDVDSGSVERLTHEPSTDVAPAISPDGTWVAFLSDRDGSWKIWGVPLSGGQAKLLVSPVGTIGSWLEHDIQWIR